MRQPRPDRLDADQSAVVALPAEASGLVAGAPGSGKTRTVVARVRALLAGGLTPEQLLVLTPSRRSAAALRDDLVIEGERATSGALARSVAAFAFQVVRAAAVHTAGAEPPQLLTGTDEDALIRDLLDGDAEDERAGRRRWPDGLGADVRATAGFRAEVRAFLAECATLGIGADALARRAGREQREVWTALASFAEEYHAVRAGMRGAHRDAAGLVREAVGLLRHAPAGAAWLGDLAGLRVLLVDDAQELTLGGVELLEAARARGIAVLAFGDPDLGSGAFRGARPENFARLARLGPVHILSGAHRGTPSQRDLVAAVTARIGAAGVVAHRRRPQSVEADGSVRAYTVRSAGEEYDTIARLLRERHVHDEVAWDDCVVIAHDTRQVAALEAELSARDVPTRSAAPAAALAAHGAVRDLLRIVDAAARPIDEWGPDEPGAVLEAGGFDPLELRRLRIALRRAEVAEAEQAGRTPRAARDVIASAFAHPLEFAFADTREARRAERIAETVVRVRAQIDAGATAHELLWTVWERAGRERAWAEAARGSGPLAEQARRDLDAVVALFQAAKRHGERDDGTTALAFIRGTLESDVAEDRLAAPEPSGVVRVLTPAASLGVEADTVVVAGVQDGVWPNPRVRGGLLETWRLAEDASDALDRRREVLHDELRLFARAVSRARRQLIVTAVDDDDTGPSPLFELLPEPSGAPPTAAHPLSLRGLVAQHRRTLTDAAASASARAEAAGQLALLAAEGVPGADPDEWYGLRPPSVSGPVYDTATSPVRVSPSRLAQVEQCALDWAVTELGGDRGRVSAGVGTILHSALEHAVGVDEDALWQAVEARWSELEFDAAWRERAERTRARDLVRRLAAYLRAADAAGVSVVAAEPRFQVALPLDDADPDGPGLVLSGSMDRVERTADGRVVIVDLKTGRTEPTSAAKVADNPQLAAYQLAFDHGAIAEVAGEPAGGAKLIVLRGTRGAPYAEPMQPPMDDATRAAFVERLRAAARTMAADVFAAPYEAHCRDEHTRGVCAIHTVKAVSAS